MVRKAIGKMQREEMSNGYPTQDDLMKIRNWRFKNVENELDEFMNYIQSIWHWGEKQCYKDNNQWILHTGGWSGNEEIISEMQSNMFFWFFYWEESRRGGHYKFSSIYTVHKKHYGNFGKD